MRQSLTAAVEFKDGRVVVTGVGGAVLQSRDGESFRVDTLPELRGYTAATGDEKGGLLLFGSRG